VFGDTVSYGQNGSTSRIVIYHWVLLLSSGAIKPKGELAITPDLKEKLVETSGFARWCFDNGLEPNLSMDIVLADEYAVSEVQRFAQYLKDQGFCPDQAFSNHVMDCYAGFNSKEGQDG